MIFFSWSKNDSKQYASLMKEFLETLFKSERLIWFSETDIESGKSFFERISFGLNQCDSIILFLTSENIYNPWIQFELGNFYNRDSCKIWPLYFDGEIQHNTTVFEHIQILKMNEKNCRSLIEEIYQLYQQELAVSWEEVLEDFSTYWAEFSRKLMKVKNRFSEYAEFDIHNLMFYMGDNFSSPGREASVLRVNQGFETAELYRFILSNTRRRLWVFGRKNKKMFDRGNVEFFNRFGKEIPNGFSLRCLFADPSEDNMNLGHAQKKRNFVDSLKICIDDAADILDEAGFSIGDSIHLYRVLRNDAIIVSDNTVYFENIKYSEDLKPEHLTGTGFFITSADSCVGEYYLNLFDNVWTNDSFVLGG